MGEGNQWYYYSRRTQNRVSGNGYWKPLGTEEAVISASNNKRVGIKKYYVFYVGEAPNSGIKTNWVMQEYRLSDSSASASSSRSSRKSHPKIPVSICVYIYIYTYNSTSQFCLLIYLLICVPSGLI